MNTPWMRGWIVRYPWVEPSWVASVEEERREWVERARERLGRMVREDGVRTWVLDLDFKVDLRCKLRTLDVEGSSVVASDGAVLAAPNGSGIDAFIEFALNKIS